MSAFSPHGRYAKTYEQVHSIFSESLYYKNIFLLELEYFYQISQCKGIIEGYDPSEDDLRKLTEMYDHTHKMLDQGSWHFHRTRISELEKVYKHDVVAVQYYLISVIKEWGINVNENLVHFMLTSQDLVNTSYTKMFSEFVRYIVDDKIDLIRVNMPMLFNSNVHDIVGMTHGQPAVPMEVKHIMDVFNNRLVTLKHSLSGITPKVKFGNGAIGNNFSLELIGKVDKPIYELNIEDAIHKFFGRNDVVIENYTFQNNNYPYILSSIYELHKLCNVLLDFVNDMWLYSMRGIIVKNFSLTEHGSSTMPQKSNPIEFENAEGNFNMAIGTCEIYMRKLNISRMQRDLSDLTMMRNLDMLMCYIIQGIDSTIDGMKKFSFSNDAIIAEFDKTPEIFMEFIQLNEKTKKYGMSYEEVKEKFSNNPGLIRKYIEENTIGYGNKN